ncbi:MAG: DUF2877 domain-containing protein, partial [Solirubrobacterales bacterium]|nr:DUF2877 domain-containing protein [Solirubrobacterales bacterium]
ASAIREACTAVALPDSPRVPLPYPPEVLRAGLAALATGRMRVAVRSLAGVGEGLTPAGDDVLAGYAAARAALGAPVTLSTQAAGRSSPLGLAYLCCAERGELPDVAARVLGAICRGSPSEVAATVPALSAWGTTSGIALAWGLVAGVSVAGSGPPAAASVGPGGPVRSGPAARTRATGRHPARVSRHSPLPHR